MLGLKVLLARAEGRLHALHVATELEKRSTDLAERDAGGFALGAKGAELGRDEAEGFFGRGVGRHWLADFLNSHLVVGSERTGRCDARNGK